MLCSRSFGEDEIEDEAGAFEDVEKAKDGESLSLEKDAILFAADEASYLFA